MLLSPDLVLEKGLEAVRISKDAQESRSKSSNKKDFKSYYGSSPLNIADMWYDLCNTNIPDASLDHKMKGEKGFKFFMMAHFFLWQKPKNAATMGMIFGVCEDYAKGEHLWSWIKRIAALKEKKIKWNRQCREECKEIFAVTVDGVDFKTWEPKHPTLPMDKKYFSKKFNKSGLRYEIAISVQDSKVVWINGPFPAAEHDVEIFRRGLKDKLLSSKKKAIADRGYVGEAGLCAVPNGCDPPELNEFKSRARCRQETFNGRIKKFNILKQTFEHSLAKHEYAFLAVCVTVQYHMDNGSRLYDV